MCDNPKTDPWEIIIDPAIARIVLAHSLEKLPRDKAEQLAREIPELANFPPEAINKFIKGVRGQRRATKNVPEGNLAHVVFDVEKLKNLPEAELQRLLQNKLIPRIIQDIKKLELERPIPDWCYAFF
jgi:hypothetical protein